MTSYGECGMPKREEIERKRKEIAYPFSHPSRTQTDIETSFQRVNMQLVNLKYYFGTLKEGCSILTERMKVVEGLLNSLEMETSG